ncbi:hypothetical protein ACFX2I_035787 [Malus domestica]
MHPCASSLFLQLLAAMRCLFGPKRNSYVASSFSLYMTNDGNNCPYESMSLPPRSSYLDLCGGCVMAALKSLVQDSHSSLNLLFSQTYIALFALLLQYHHYAPPQNPEPSLSMAAHTLASSVGSTFVYLDNGPDSTLLRRELKWLVEDAIEEPQNVDNNGGRVRLRVEIEELYMLWKQRVEERRPFQYVVGCKHWRDLVLCVEEGVLIPRPETELIVDLVGGVVLGNEGLREGLWADLGTGSGAIAIGIARVLGSGGRVIATDLSPAAIGVAAFNVQRYGLLDVVELRQGSWFEPFKDVEGVFSGFVSNPPYIPSDNISGPQAEVGRHEPRVALDDGINGMDDLLHLCKAAAFMLKPGGFFAFKRSAEVQST